MATPASSESTRRTQLLDAAYAYVLDNGISDLTLRPLASAIGSSPRVLLYLFGSKDGLVRELLARARTEELALLDALSERRPSRGLADCVDALWAWLADVQHRRLLTLWVESYARSLIEPRGPWRDFARQTVDDWLDILAGVQPHGRRKSAAGRAERTLAVAVLRGSLLDLLATGESERVGVGVRAFAASLR